MHHAQQNQPALFVMNMQEDMVKPVSSDGHPPPHFHNAITRINDYVARARANGIAIVWLFHDNAKTPAPASVTDDFVAVKKTLTAKGDAPLPDLPIEPGDQFWVRPHMVHLRDEEFKEHCKALGLDQRSAIAGCGFYLEEPGEDTAYLWAHELKDRHPAILQDLCENPVAVTQDVKAQHNIAFLKHLKEGIMWMDSADWLKVAGEITTPPAAPASTGFEFTQWLDELTAHCPVRRAAGRIIELVS